MEGRTWSRLPPRSVRGRAPLALAHPTTRTAQGAAVPRCQILPHTNEKSQVPQKRYLTFLVGAEGLGLACRLGRFAAERHWRSLTPRHAVLEWMWESAARSREEPVLPDFCRKSERGWCWFGAAGKFCGRSSSQIATDTIRQSSRICWMSTADSSFFSARAAASFSKNSRLAEMISFALR